MTDTPIWHELAPVYDVPEFGAELLAVPEFSTHNPCSCGTPGISYAGPERDCIVHGEETEACGQTEESSSESSGTSASSSPPSPSLPA